MAGNITIIRAEIEKKLGRKLVNLNQYNRNTEKLIDSKPLEEKYIARIMRRIIKLKIITRETRDLLNILSSKYSTSENYIEQYNRAKAHLRKYEDMLRVRERELTNALATENELNPALADRLRKLKVGGKYKTSRRTRKQKKSRKN